MKQTNDTTGCLLILGIIITSISIGYMTTQAHGFLTLGLLLLGIGIWQAILK